MQSCKVMNLNVMQVAVLVSVLCVAAAQYHHKEESHGHAESYATVNLLSTKHEPIHIKHEYKQEYKHEYKQPEYKHEEVEVKHEYKHEPVHHVEVEHYSHPKYEFKYGVEDKHTGDYKDQKEERDGDVVKGEYSLLQPDGRKRIVHYTASKHGGFNAIVSYSGHAIHPEVHHHKQESHESSHY